MPLRAKTHATALFDPHCELPKSVIAYRVDRLKSSQLLFRLKYSMAALPCEQGSIAGRGMATRERLLIALLDRETERSVERLTQTAWASSSK